MSCGGENFSPDGAYDSALDSVVPMKGNTPSITSSTLVDVGCVRMLNFWFSSIDEICPYNYNYSQFMLKDKCRSEKWEVYLFGQVVDMPAVVNDRCPMVQTVQKTVEFYDQDLEFSQWQYI